MLISGIPPELDQSLHLSGLRMPEHMNGCTKTQQLRCVHTAGVKLLQFSPRNLLMNVYGQSSCCTISQPACLTAPMEPPSFSHTPLFSFNASQHQSTPQTVSLSHPRFISSVFPLTGAHHTSAVAVVVASYWQQNAINKHWDTTVTTNWSILITTLPLCIPMTTDSDEQRNLQGAMQALLGIG